jgi:hypothetical protein
MHIKSDSWLLKYAYRGDPPQPYPIRKWSSEKGRYTTVGYAPLQLNLCSLFWNFIGTSLLIAIITIALISLGMVAYQNPGPFFTAVGSLILVLGLITGMHAGLEVLQRKGTLDLVTEYIKAKKAGWCPLIDVVKEVENADISPSAE